MTTEIIYPATSPEFIRGFANKCASEGLAVSQIEDLLDLELTRQCVQRHGPELMKTAGIGSLVGKALGGLWAGTKGTARFTGGRILPGAAVAGGYSWLTGGQRNTGNYGALPYVPGYGGGSATPSNAGGVDPLSGFALSNSAFPNNTSTNSGTTTAHAPIGGGMKVQLEAVNTAIANATDPVQKQRLVLTQRQLQAQQTSALAAINAFKDDSNYRQMETSLGDGVSAVPTRSRASLKNYQRYLNPMNWGIWSRPGEFSEDYADRLNEFAPKFNAATRSESYYGKK